MENQNINLGDKANLVPLQGLGVNSPLGGGGSLKLFVNSKKMLADLQTPVGIYLKIRDLYTNSVLLESSDYHGVENSYSYIGFCPIGGISVNRFLISEEYPDGSRIETQVTDKLTKSSPLGGLRGSYETIRSFKKDAGRFTDAGRNLSQNTRFIY